MAQDTMANVSAAFAAIVACAHQTSSRKADFVAASSRSPLRVLSRRSHRGVNALPSTGRHRHGRRPVLSFVDGRSDQTPRLAHPGPGQRADNADLALEMPWA